MVFKLSIPKEREDTAYFVLSRIRDRARTAVALCALQWTDPAIPHVGINSYLRALDAWNQIKPHTEYWGPEDERTLSVMHAQIDACILLNEEAYASANRTLRAYAAIAARGSVVLANARDYISVVSLLEAINKEFTLLIELQQALVAFATYDDTEEPQGA